MKNIQSRFLISMVILLIIPHHLHVTEGVSFLRNFMPHPYSGVCEANKTYVLKSIKDFYDHPHDLECIYRGGRLPTRIPRGPLYASILTILNTITFNPWIEAIWEGKYITEIECNGTLSYVGWNAFPTGPTMPFVPQMGPTGLNVEESENDDNGPGLFVQYKTDVFDYCPELKKKLLKSVGPGAISGSNLWSKNIPFMDVLRHVGKQLDGGDLYILKTYLRDWFRSDEKASTTSYTAILNYDEEANPDFPPGGETLPIKETVNYRLPGLMDFVRRGLPVDNLLTTPGKTLGQVRRELMATGRNVGRFAIDLPGSFNRILSNAVQWVPKYRSKGDY